MSAALLGATVVEAVVLAGVGIVLFFAPTTAHDVWAWAPFNTRFLASLYLASLAAVASLAVIARWAPARLVVPMIFVFTTIVLVVSIAYPGPFEWERPATWGWFFLYVTLPANAAYFLWTLRGTPPAVPKPPPELLRRALLLAAVPLGAYGVGLLAAPAALTEFWPWPIDGFHGRLYSAVFVTLAVGSVLVARAAARVELRTLGYTETALGGFALAGLLVVDADVDKVDWSRAGTWGWVGIFAAIVAFGAVLVAAGARGEAVATRAAPR